MSEIDLARNRDDQAFGTVDEHSHWYLYDGCEITGPFTIKQLEKRCLDETKFLVSRAGLASWFPLAKLKQELLTNKALNDQVQEQRYELEGMLKQTMRHWPELMKIEVDQNQPVQAKPHSTEAKKNSRLSRQKPMFLHEPSYLTLKSRLRLGECRHFGFVGILQFFVSFGLSSYGWLSSVSRDIAFHLHNRFTLNGLRPWMILVPGLHWWVFHKLAIWVQLMEKENHYERTNPYFVVLLAFCPPIAMAYLQKRLNEHWQLHVRNF